MRMHCFSVTAEDISAGECRHAKRCPVVLALLRSLEGQDPWPDTEHVAFRRENIPDDIRNWYSRFDRGLPVEPQTFWIDLDAIYTKPVVGFMRPL